MQELSRSVQQMPQQYLQAEQKSLVEGENPPDAANTSGVLEEEEVPDADPNQEVYGVLEEEEPIEDTSSAHVENKEEEEIPAGFDAINNAPEQPEDPENAIYDAPVEQKYAEMDVDDPAHDPAPAPVAGLVEDPAPGADIDQSDNEIKPVYDELPIALVQEVNDAQLASSGYHPDQIKKMKRDLEKKYGGPLNIVEANASRSRRLATTGKIERHDRKRKIYQKTLDIQVRKEAIAMKWIELNELESVGKSDGQVRKRRREEARRGALPDTEEDDEDYTDESSSSSSSSDSD